jgi:hypothetical protein
MSEVGNSGGAAMMDAKTPGGPVVLPSETMLDGMGWERAIAGLRAPGALFLRIVTAFYAARGGPCLAESVRLAVGEWSRAFGGSRPPLSGTQVRHRLGRLDQCLLRSMRA